MVESMAVKKTVCAGHMQWIDVLKGIGILCVVYGHVIYAPYVYLFHVPLFFLVSGFLFTPGRSVVSYFKKSTKRLMLPYAVYIVALNCLDLRYSLAHGSYFPWTELLLGGGMLPDHVCPLWFLPVLWMSLNLFNVLSRMPFSLWWLLAAVLAVSCARRYYEPLVGVECPLCLDVVPLATLWVWIGCRVRPLYDKYAERMRSRFYIWLAVGIVVLVVIHEFPGGMTMNLFSGDLGLPVVGVAVACVMTTAMAVVARGICRLRYIAICLAYIGNASMVIMCVHLFVIIRFWRAYPGAVIEPFVLSLAVSLFVYEIARRYPLSRRLFGIHR